MKALLQEACLILVISCALAVPSIKPAVTTSNDNKLLDKANSLDYQYEDYGDDIDQQDEILYNENKPCPRDCVCTESPTSKIAHCSRLEVGTQKFGDEITGLVVENVDAKHPLVLTDMMFRKLGLHHITNVKITKSAIASISPTAFKGLHELYSANLSGNRIERINPNIFAFNNKLTLVALSDNPLIINADMPNQPLLNSSSIQELEIARCGIKSLPKTALSKLPHLIYINLSGNKLQELDPLVFSELPALEEVDLADNFLKSIPDNLFNNNNEITTLRLKGNPISSVIGVQLKELLTIDLSMGDIKTVGPSMFDGMMFISNMNLSGNDIQKIHNQAFHQLTTMNYLDLSNNDLDFVSDQLIKNNVELDIFKISKNPLLKSLPDEGFACSSKYFNIFLFDASECSIEVIANNTFKTMPALTQLFLSNNNIRSVGSSLHACPRLVEIDLSFNMLSTLHMDTFSANKELGKLNLAGNPLTAVSASLFINNPVLTWIDLSSCQLTSLWSGQDYSSVGVMNNLHFINVSDNFIKSINIKELQMINKLYTLDISQNPLVCSVDFQDLMTWLGEHNVSPAARDLQSAKMEAAEKIIDKRYKWEFLAKSVCDPKKSDTASNEQRNEIDLISKDGLSGESLDTNEDNTDKNKNYDYIEDDEDEDDIDEDDYDGNYDGDADTDSKKGKDAKVPEKKVDGEDVNKIYDNIDKKLITIPLVNSMMQESEKTQDIIEDLEKESELEKDMESEILESYAEERNSFRQYIWPMKITVLVLGIIILIISIIRLMKYCSYVKDNNRVRCAIISINPGNNRMKKDCGLVYQQLTEELSGPKTPIISRQILGSNKAANMSYQSSPFHHSNITPEHV